MPVTEMQRISGSCNKYKSIFCSRLIGLVFIIEKLSSLSKLHTFTKSFSLFLFQDVQNFLHPPNYELIWI